MKLVLLVLMGGAFVSTLRIAGLRMRMPEMFRRK
jgi:hypothetical protein